MRRLAPLLAAALAVAAALAAVGRRAAPATAHAKTVWLCKPGMEANPCAGRLDTARFSPAGQPLGGDSPARRARRRVDCFYVYPTVSDQKTPSATRSVDPELRSIARWQAARYAGTCRVFAPVYRQVTLTGLSSAGAEDGRARAYRDVRAAWRDYLARHNHGRGVVLIGHSQGTFHLRKLVAEEIDGDRRLRRRLVSAILLGGNVTVAQGRDVGGDFRHVPACRAADQLGCVVAFSAYNGPVPADAPFGRAQPGRAVLCVNPAALGGGPAPIEPQIPRAPFAPGTGIAAVIAALGFPVPSGATATWLAFPGAYTGECVEEDGASVLRVTPAPGAPALQPVPATWGLHMADANIALGDLVALVRRQAAAYARR